MYPSATNIGRHYFTYFYRCQPPGVRSSYIHVKGYTLYHFNEDSHTVLSDNLPIGIHLIIKLNKLSSLTKLIAVTAYTRRFIANCRRPDSTRVTGPLTVSELTQAELHWICQVECLTFHDEVTTLNLKSHRHSPLIRQLRLFLDDNNLVCCGGHIHNAPHSELARFPYLLPSRHYFTELDIRNTHITHLHSGVRQAYWIPSAHQHIKAIIRKCVTCRRTSGKPYPMPEPPPLVKSRVSQLNPFQITGVDFTGVLFIRTPNGERKVYICLFTCACLVQFTLKSLQT